MKRLREQLHAERTQRAKPAPVPADAAVATPARAKPAAAAEPDAESGKCPECGKTKPVQNGVMANHQKGFGKACPGSRKPPA